MPIKLHNSLNRGTDLALRNTTIPLFTIRHKLLGLELDKCGLGVNVKSLKLTGDGDRCDDGWGLQLPVSGDTGENRDDELTTAPFECQDLAISITFSTLWQEGATDHPKEQPGPENGLNQFTPLEKRTHASCFLLSDLPPQFPRRLLVPEFKLNQGIRAIRGVTTAHAAITTRMAFGERVNNG